MTLAKNGLRMGRSVGQKGERTFSQLVDAYLLRQGRCQRHPTDGGSVSGLVESLMRSDGQEILRWGQLTITTAERGHAVRPGRQGGEGPGGVVRPGPGAHLTHYR